MTTTRTTTTMATTTVTMTTTAKTTTTTVMTTNFERSGQRGRRSLNLIICQLDSLFLGYSDFSATVSAISASDPAISLTHFRITHNGRICLDRKNLSFALCKSSRCESTHYDHTMYLLSMLLYQSLVDGHICGCHGFYVTDNLLESRPSFFFTYTRRVSVTEAP